MAQPENLLKNVLVPLYEHEGETYLEDQACNGVRLWADNFEHVTFMFMAREATPPQNYIPLDRAIRSHADRVTIEKLPWAYRPDHFIGTLRHTEHRIAGLIGQAKYLNFGIGGCLFGDWGAVAARQAYRLGRPYSIWTDRVESQVVRLSAGKGPWRRRLQAHLYHRPMAALEKTVIRRAALGLFHGRETYDAYAPYCDNPHMVHDFHISKGDHLPGDAVTAKQETCQRGPLKICYVGRLDPMKGPHDWVAVLEGLQERGVDFEAVWIGEGSEGAAVRARIAQSGLQARVSLPGFSSDRAEVLGVLRGSDVMLFCHKTPESPRCLIEALISACPIVGYDSAYPRDLIAQQGGGILTPLNDVAALTDTVAGLAADRDALAALIGRAAREGGIFDDVSVFRHRSDLIKSYL